MTALSNDPQTAIRDIHAHPELTFEEVRTVGVVARELTRLGIKHQTGVAKTGVVGPIEGGRPGKVLVIRADMDALPIHEQTGLPWASTVDGKMHACGHFAWAGGCFGPGLSQSPVLPRWYF
jgi:metal-dependent amidase/aminoacylase/carboxypeptidase family protein